MKASLTKANAKPEEGDEDYAERSKTYKFNPNIEKILLQLKGNTNLIFSNGDLGEVKTILDGEVRPSPAKPGMIAPDDVTIPAGPTGLDPKQTSFFGNLQIQTKIVKAQIDIVAEKKVINAGDKIGGTEAQLLDKLKIYPFQYKMEVKKVLQNGSMFDAKVLDLGTAEILKKFQAENPPPPAPPQAGPQGAPAGVQVQDTQGSGGGQMGTGTAPTPGEPGFSANTGQGPAQ